MSEIRELIIIEHLLENILEQLKDMQQQERSYWETWRKAKSEEVRKREG